MQTSPECEQNVDNLIALTEQLSQLLASEADLLKEHRPSEIKALNETKSKVSALYQKELSALKSDPRKIQALSKEKRDALRDVTDEFRKRTDRHLRVLQGFRQISEGIVKSVADEVAAKDTPAAGYGNHAMAPKPTAAASRAFAVNQVI